MIQQDVARLFPVHNTGIIN